MDPETTLDAALAAFRDRPASSAVFTDFDGTLAPIVDDPRDAVPLESAVETLARLSRKMGLVVVVSGRPVTWLARQLPGASEITLAGLYGMERMRGGEVLEVPEASAWRGVVAEVTAAAEAEAPPGVFVERKGLTVVLHVRTSPEHDGWISQWAAAQAARTGLVAHAGRKSVELRPPVDIDKGTVVRELAAGYEAVCFLGDDVGDLAAFDALAQLAAKGVHTLAVAVRSEESPAELLAAADLVVDGPPGVLEVLTRLAS